MDNVSRKSHKIGWFGGAPILGNLLILLGFEGGKTSWNLENFPIIDTL